MWTALVFSSALSAFAVEPQTFRPENTALAMVPTARSASLLEADDNAIPASLLRAMAGDLQAQLERAGERFGEALAQPSPGGGDAPAAASADPVLAFVLGTFGGFGLSHLLLEHQNRRGVAWLAVDGGLLTLVITFLVVAGPVGGVFLVAFVLERVIQGLDAMAGLGKPGFPFGLAPTDPTDRFAGLSLSDTPNVFSLRF